MISSHYCYYTYCKFSPLFYPLRTPHKSIHFGICHFPYFYCWSIHDDLLPPSLIIKTRWNTHDSCWPTKGVTVISIIIHNKTKCYFSIPIVYLIIEIVLRGQITTQYFVKECLTGVQLQHYFSRYLLLLLFTVQSHCCQK